MFAHNSANVKTKFRLRLAPLLVAFSALASGLAAATNAHADILTLGNYNHTFYISTNNLYIRPGEYYNVDHIQDMGGDAKAVLNGELLAGTYCVGLTDLIYLDRSYEATTVNSTGSVFGESINNAGAISWLLGNFATVADTDDEQNALQAAIWRTEYGSGFELDGVDNGKAGNSVDLKNAYQYYLSSLGSKTADISNCLWISANTAPGQANPAPDPSPGHYQGLVGIRSSVIATIPETNSIALVLAGGLPLVGIVTRRRRK